MFLFELERESLSFMSNRNADPFIQFPACRSKVKFYDRRAQCRNEQSEQSCYNFKYETGRLHFASIEAV